MTPAYRFAVHMGPEPSRRLRPRVFAPRYAQTRAVRLHGAGLLKERK